MVKTYVKHPGKYDVGVHNCLIASSLVVRASGGQVNEPPGWHPDGKGDSPTWTDPNTHLKWLTGYAAKNPSRAVSGTWSKDMFTVTVPSSPQYPRDKWLKKSK